MKTENYGVRAATNWSLGLGVVLVILGILAISAPLVATLAAVFMTGWLLIFAGIEQIVYAVLPRYKGGLFTKLLLAGLYIAGGGMLLRRPITGAITVTMIIAALLIFDGILEILLAIRLRGTVATGWLMLGGLLSLILGGITWRTLAGSSVWLIGTLIGIRLIFKGIEHIGLSPHTRRFDQRPGWNQRAA